jgi:hypothetical protein
MGDRDDQISLSRSIVDPIRKSRDCPNTHFASLDSRHQRSLLNPELRPSHLVGKSTTQTNSLFAS